MQSREVSAKRPAEMLTRDKAIARYLATGEHDPYRSGWTGPNFMARAILAARNGWKRILARCAPL